MTHWLIRPITWSPTVTPSQINCKRFQSRANLNKNTVFFWRGMDVLFCKVVHWLYYLEYGAYSKRTFITSDVLGTYSLWFLAYSGRTLCDAWHTLDVLLMMYDRLGTYSLLCQSYFEHSFVCTDLVKHTCMYILQPMRLNKWCTHDTHMNTSSSILRNCSKKSTNHCRAQLQICLIF